MDMNEHDLMANEGSNDDEVNKSDLSPLSLLSSSVASLFKSDHRVDDFPGKDENIINVLTYHVKLIEGTPLQRVSMPFDMKMSLLKTLRLQLEGVYMPVDAISEGRFISRLFNEYQVGVTNVIEADKRQKHDAILCLATSMWYLVTTYVAYATLQHEIYHGNVLELTRSKAYFNNMLDIVWVRTMALEKLAERTMKVDGYQVLCAMIEVAEHIDYHEKIPTNEANL